jgi:hypothetical protein
MKEYFKILVLIFSFLTLMANNVFAGAGTARPTAYKVTAFKLEYCAGASTEASCLDATTVGESAAGFEMDLSDSTSAVSFGNAGLLEIGKTYTYGQVTMNREFTLAGTVTGTGAAAAACKTGGTDGSEDLGGDATNGGAVAEQVLAPPDTAGGATEGNAYNTATAVGGTGTAGQFVDNANFMQVRWELTTPFTVVAGKIPSMEISFDLSAALVFNDGGGNGACDGNDLYPGKPVIDNTFSY